MRNLRKLWLNLIGLSIAVILLNASLLHGQSSTKSVTAGEEITLIETKQKIEVTKSPTAGTTRRDSTGTGADQVNRLIYKANETSSKKTDQVEYTLDGAQPPQSVSIEILPKDEVFKAVLLLFTLAVVLESALALLFNWRPFVEAFNSRAVRPIVSFIIAYIFVNKFGLDLLTTIVNASTSSIRLPDATGMVLTAMVIAGGSAAVNNLLVGLGFRQKRTPETIALKPPADKAWIAVRIIRNIAVGPVKVFIGPQPAPIVTEIHGNSRPSLRYFLNDRGRFPGSGGYEVKADSTIEVIAIGFDQAGKENVRKTWGPYKVAGNAIIDLDFEM